MTREPIMQALFARLAGAASFGTVGRRLVFWSKVADQPALFLRNAGESVEPRRTGMPAKTVLDCEVWLYSKSAEDDVPAVGLNTLIDAVQAALQPPPGMPAQTLGGLVVHCWIEGHIDMHPGDLDGQAIAVIPVKILVPSFGG
jgi:hypothetical protein